MGQCLHLLIVDATSDRALVDWFGGQWLLPVFSSRERVRIPPLAARIAAAHGVIGHTIGQWLGRISPSDEPNPDTVDWLVVFKADPFRTDAGQKFLGCTTWSPIDSLATASAVVEYQRWALDRLRATGTRSLRVPGPFGGLDWLDKVFGWVEVVAGPPNRADVVPYRATPHAAVIRLSTPAGMFYFKGLAPESSNEALVTMGMAAAAPASFAPTLAAETAADGALWWLMRECPGTPLARDPTLEKACRTAAACGRLQRVVPLDRLPPVDIERTAEWAESFLDGAANGPQIAAVIQRISDACLELTHASAPVSWVPLDLDPTNVLLDGEAVRFVDLDESYIGSAPLAAATFARRVARLTRGVDRGTIRAAYEEGLNVPPYSPRTWEAFDVVSSVLEVQAGWRRVRSNLERGELTAPLGSLERRIANRLISLLASRCSPFVQT